jgi:DNA modification methylase
VSPDDLASREARSVIRPYYDEDGITLYHGDCREILPQLGPFDALVTDPPYGIGFSEYASHDDRPDTYADLIGDVINEAERHIATGYCCVMQSASRASEWASLIPRRWVPIALPKNFTQMGGDRRLVRGTDYALWWRVGEPPKRDEAPRDWFMCNTANMALKTQGHPCPRPLDGVKHLVACSSERGWLVCDPFSGSGTTLEAAKNLGRRAIGIEIEERYCEIAVNRLRQGVLAFA